MLLQRLAPTETGGPGAGSHTHPVLGDPTNLHQPLLHQCRKHLRKQLVQRPFVLDAEVAQRVIVHLHPAAKPTIRVLLPAQPLHLTRATHTLRGRPHPQRHQQPHVRGRTSCLALLHLQPNGEAAQVQPLDQIPDQPHAMVRRNRLVQHARHHAGLRTVGPLEPHRAQLHSRLAGTVRFLRFEGFHSR